MNDRFSDKLVLNHKDGDCLYPVRITNRDTGRNAFRISKNGNTKEDCIEIEDESEMIIKVTDENYNIRCATRLPYSKGGKNGIYGLNKRSIIDYRLNNI